MYSTGTGNLFNIIQMGYIYVSLCHASFCIYISLSHPTSFWSIHRIMRVGQSCPYQAKLWPTSWGHLNFIQFVCKLPSASGKVWSSSLLSKQDYMQYHDSHKKK